MMAGHSSEIKKSWSQALAEILIQSTLAVFEWDYSVPFSEDGGIGLG